MLSTLIFPSTDLLRVVPRHVGLVFDELGEADGRVEHHRALRGDRDGEVIYEMTLVTITVTFR